jgi:hypothetical protein
LSCLSLDGKDLSGRATMYAAIQTTRIASHASQRSDFVSGSPAKAAAREHSCTALEHFCAICRAPGIGFFNRNSTTSVPLNHRLMNPSVAFIRLILSER